MQPETRHLFQLHIRVVSGFTLRTAIAMIYGDCEGAFNPTYEDYFNSSIFRDKTPSSVSSRYK